MLTFNKDPEKSLVFNFFFQIFLNITESTKYTVRKIYICVYTRTHTQYIKYVYYQSLIIDIQMTLKEKRKKKERLLSKPYIGWSLFTQIRLMI